MRGIRKLLSVAAIALILFMSQLNTTDDLNPFGPEEATQTIQETELLPARYDLRDVGKMTRVQDQGDIGTCWAIATVTAMETTLLPEESLEFSVDHMSIHNSYAYELDEGGNSTMAVAYLTAWQGPVLEEDDPYGDYWSPEGLSPVKHVQEVQMFTGFNSQGIKEAIYHYGAVESAFYMDMENEFSGSEYYNPWDAAYCYTGEKTESHDLTIIGWDDNYPASNFTVPVDGDGAWICQNSWGYQFGENGVFYVSYSDVNLGRNGVAYTCIEPVDNYDHIYQTDLCGWVGQLGYDKPMAYMANVYTAEQDEKIAAVGFYATNQWTSYEVYLSGSSPRVNGEPVASGYLTEAGYYTIKLDAPVPVKAGEAFTVIVKIITPNATQPVAIEYAYPGVTDQVDLSDGDGYVSEDGKIWEDTESEQDCNVCLKVYTVD